MTAKKVEDFIEKHSHWKNELSQLRTFLNSFPEFEETVKWGAPTYTVNKKNVIGLGAFKNHYALWFFNGSLLKKNTELLVNTQEGKTKALRQIRFNKDEKPKLDTLKKYIEEAIQLQLDGKKVEINKSKPLNIPPELIQKLKEDRETKLAFEKLTKGKQREFADYISEAKCDITKQKRLEKIIPLIKNGVGLNDKYRK
ncbi:YdeI/OmpD-associated family protein [Mesonia maritima]|uniref:Uncharacterized protein YdeI (YjbR/CyaY-like superfamily) n=1 Tax=Mesonia maritima TaxID=1793873 RepID=A0ABU1K5Y9_9FLAO|nr:DUF1801 domain-containing protein [Mesonia maritima]MDR6300417.1 uncharacterized protein YdeI (YjbR/CyaY-like superfamily) [Mesonia maritima]